jgi:hypothetical protein
LKPWTTDLLKRYYFNSLQPINTVQMIRVISVLAFAGLAISFANAARVEDYSDTATKKSLEKITDYCAKAPNANITRDLIENGNLSEFYSDYTCDKALQDKSFLNKNDPDSNNTTTINLLH